MIVGLDHVQVAAPAGCEDDARAFYGDLLGLEEVEKPAPLVGRGGVWFRIGDQQLHVGAAEVFAPATKAHPAFRVSSADALDRLADRLEREGVAVTRPHRDEIPGTERIFAADPWGNRIELVASSHR